MKIKKLMKNDDSVVGIIVAVLLIGLILIVMSILQTVFLPNWMKNIEADHMDEVSQQFSQLKFAIDIQKVFGEEDLPVSAPITIGYKAFPILQSSRSYGSLNINRDACIFEITNSPLTEGIRVGNIVFSSFNSYFIDQSYVYESGAIIVDQEDGNIMKIRPDIKLEFNGSDLSFNLTLIDISTIGNKGSASGYGTYPILVENIDQDESLPLEKFNAAVPGNVQIIITSSFVESWDLYIKSLLNELGLPYTSISKDSNHLIINLDTLSGEDGVGDVYINLDVIEIGAQIAPGWVERPQ